MRVDAIRAAIAKGRDYAAALGGRLSAVEHIADPGLIGGDGQDWAATSGRSLRMVRTADPTGHSASLRARRRRPGWSWPGSG